jgi:hypothetical protein
MQEEIALERQPATAKQFSTLLEDRTWHGNLDAFNDILRGGFGTPDDGFVLRWVDSARSREALGWRATIEGIERRLERCHPMNKDDVRAALESARRHEARPSSTRSWRSSRTTVLVARSPKTVSSLSCCERSIRPARLRRRFDDLVLFLRNP